MTKNMNDQQKIDVLLEAWKDLSGQITSVIGYANRASFSYLTLCSALVLYVKTYGVAESLKLYFLSGILVVMGGVVIIFLTSNHRRLTWLCQSLTNIQIALGFYKDEFFSTKEDNSTYGSLFNPIGKEWGVNSRFLNRKSRIILVVAVGVISIVFLNSIDLKENESSQQIICCQNK